MEPEKWDTFLEAYQDLKDSKEELRAELKEWRKLALEIFSDFAEHTEDDPTREHYFERIEALDG